MANEARTEDERLGSETAFPLPDGHTQVRRWAAGYGEYRAAEATAKGGLTKRELFAAMAMQGAIASGQLRGPSECVSYAMQCADTLLKELAK